MACKKILITGATGFTGQHAVRYFEMQGYHVIGTSREIGNDRLVKVDLTDREKVVGMVRQLKPDYVLHLAGQNAVQRSWKKPLATFDANVGMTLNLLEAIRREHPKAKVIIVGSALEDNIKLERLPSHPYGISKTLQSWVAKKWADLFALNIIIVKPSNLIGPGFSNGVCALFAENIAKMEKRNQSSILTIENPAIKRDFLDVRDVVRGYGILLHKGEKGEIYEIGAGAHYALGEIARTYQELSHQHVKIIFQQKPAQLMIPRLKNEKMRELGWEPMHTLKESLSDCLMFYRENC